MTTQERSNPKKMHTGPHGSVWQFADREQERQMLEPVTRENCGRKLKLIREISGLTRKDLAEALGVVESTVYRLEMAKTKPTQSFMLRLSALMVIGHARYSEMSEVEKEALSGYLGLTQGITAGIGGAIAAISAGTTIGRLSAAGITSGLAAVGGRVLGGLSQKIPVSSLVGSAGLGLIKGIQAICQANRLQCREVDGRYEINPEPVAEAEPSACEETDATKEEKGKHKK